MKRKQGLAAFGGARGDRGFTMIEVLITIVILAILLTIAIPGFARWLPNYRLRGASRDLYSTLQLAKMTAVKDHSNCGVLFIDQAGDDNDLYRLIGSGANRIFENGGNDDVILKEVNLAEYGSGVSFGASLASGVTDFVTYDQNVVVFSSLGTSTAGFAHLKNNKDASFRIGTFLSGAVDMKRWRGQWE